MSPMETTLETGRRERRRQETEQRIFLAALKLFEQQGFMNTTVEQITEAADVGKGTFFNYFPSKEHVLLAVFAMVTEHFTELERQVPTITNVREHMMNFARQVRSQPGRTPLLLRNVFGAAMTNKVIHEPFRILMARAREVVTKVFARGQELGQIRTDLSAKDLARTLQQSILGTEMVWSVAAEKDDLNEWIECMFKIFWDGASARPFPVSPDGSQRRK
jgi:AcrR family transcriptional regulator